MRKAGMDIITKTKIRANLTSAVLTEAEVRNQVRNCRLELTEEKHGAMTNGAEAP